MHFLKIGRRDFIKVMGGAAAGLMLPSGLDAKEDEKTLRNENKPDFYIRFYKPFKALDPSKWILKVGGLCEKPFSTNLSDIRKLPKETQVSRLKCVECWSAKAKWGGFCPKTLFDIVKPKENANYLYFYSADDYFEYISLEELLKPRVLFVYEMNEAPLPDIHGAPLRLIIPFKYGYKNVKTIVRLDFVDKGGAGYWSNYGYSVDGTIQPGTDHPLDLGEYRELKRQGEVEY